MMDPSRTPTLPLGWRQADTYRRENYVCSDCNRAAYDHLHRWPNWPQNVCVLSGPTGSGKTHLAHLFAEHTQAVWAEAPLTDATTAEGTAPLIVEDIHTLSPTQQDALFHLLQQMWQEGRHALLTSTVPPAQLPWERADLASRLRAGSLLSIAPPDDALLGALLHKHASDRQLLLPEAVRTYLLARMERSPAAAEELIARLDHAALSAGKALTLPLARRIMEKISSTS